MIRILLVDDHPTFRLGMKALLSQEKDFMVIGEAGNAVEALTFIKEKLPDIVLLDISMPGLNGLQALPRILALHPDARVIILTAFDNDDYLNEAIMKGAYGYLMKSRSPGEIDDAIREVHNGFRLMDPSQINRFIEAVRSGEVKRSTETYELSEREIDLLKRMADGASYEEIAEAMYLSLPTVKRNVNTIISKMMVKNRVQAVAEAVKMGII